MRRFWRGSGGHRAELVARREDVVTNIGRENNRLDTTGNAWITKEIESLIKVLQAHLTSIAAWIETLVADCDTLAAENRRLRSVPGIGPAVAAVLRARLPELGQLDHCQKASRAGLAPYASDSGRHRGKRLIWGGRAEVRRAPYIAAKSACQSDPGFKACRNRLQDAGKPFKVAIIACVRKPLTMQTAKFRKREDFRKGTA